MTTEPSRPDRLINPKRHTTFTQVPDWLLAHADGLSYGAVLAYSLLARMYRERNGYADPSLERLAGYLHVSTRQVQNYLGELTSARLILTHRRGLGQSNVYVFPDHPWRDETAPFPGEPAPEGPFYSDRHDAADQSGRDVPPRREWPFRPEGKRDAAQSGTALPTQILKLDTRGDTPLGISAEDLDHCTDPTTFAPEAVAEAAAPARVTGKQEWLALWRSAFGRTPTAMQIAMLERWADAADRASLPGLIEACIRDCGERGANASYLRGMVEGCLTRKEFPGPAAAQNRQNNRPGRIPPYRKGSSDKRDRASSFYDDGLAEQENARQLARLGLESRPA